VIRVLVADDQTLVRSGFRAILESQSDIEVVGEAEDGVEALKLARELRPEVVLMDVRMPRLDGIQATRRLMQEIDPPRVLMLTTFDLDEYVYEAMKAGASGFLLKDVPKEELIAGVRTVSRGEALLASAITRRLIEAFVQKPPPTVVRPAELEELSERELEVLKLIGRGRSNAEIAAELYLSTSTVKTHVAHVLRKLSLRDRVQAVCLAYESGLMQPAAGKPES
jgi:DNA-binding NarL/FixJ family response regulator